MRLKDKIPHRHRRRLGMGAPERSAAREAPRSPWSTSTVPPSTPSSGDRGGRRLAIGITADLREDANARRIVRETANAFGGLDFVWNHLGHPGPASVGGIDMADAGRRPQPALADRHHRGGLRAQGTRRRRPALYGSPASGLRGSQFSPVFRR
jgi:NAD(P)-dependent dehydrogenase (short-subunit alcohol dehydrogenase family)